MKEYIKVKLLFVLIVTCSDISAWNGAGYEPLVAILGLPVREDAEESCHIHHYVVVSLGNVRDMATFVISPHITKRKEIVQNKLTESGAVFNGAQNTF